MHRSFLSFQGLFSLLSPVSTVFPDFIYIFKFGFSFLFASFSFLFSKRKEKEGEKSGEKSIPLYALFEILKHL